MRNIVTCSLEKLETFQEFRNTDTDIEENWSFPSKHLNTDEDEDEESKQMFCLSSQTAEIT